MAEGCDVSQFQGTIAPEWFARWDFVLIRAFDRHGNADTRFPYNWFGALGRTLRGAYGWPVPGADNYQLGRALRGAAPDAELGWWADYEHSTEYGLATVQELEDYIAGIESAGPGIVGFYSNIPTCPRSPMLDRLPWWVANYGPNDGTRHDLTLPPPRSWQIHQYTSRGGPDGTGLDRDYAPVLTLRRDSMIYPKAVWRPGFNAGYTNGRNQMRLCVCHYTVGRDSAPVGDRGYFNFLVRRDGEVVQFAEADALTWHAGTANRFGPGIEVEYLPGVDDDLWTPEAYQATAELVEWLIGLGIPDGFYDGPRIDPAGYTGFLTHRSVQQPDGHSDWWPDLPRAAPTPPPEDDMKGFYAVADDTNRVPGVWYMFGGYRVWCKTKGMVDIMSYVGWSHNTWENPAVLAADELERFPVIGDRP